MNLSNSCTSWSGREGWAARFRGCWGGCEPYYDRSSQWQSRSSHLSTFQTLPGPTQIPHVIPESPSLFRTASPTHRSHRRQPPFIKLQRGDRRVLCGDTVQDCVYAPGERHDDRDLPVRQVGAGNLKLPRKRARHSLLSG